MIRSISWRYLTEEQALIVSSIGRYYFVIRYYHSHNGIEVSIYYSIKFSNFRPQKYFLTRKAQTLKEIWLLKTFNMMGKTAFLCGMAMRDASPRRSGVEGEFTVARRFGGVSGGRALGEPFIIIPNIQIQINIKIMTQSLEINDEHLMHKLQQIVPELRKQLEATIRSRYQMDLQRMQQQKRRQLTRKYELMIKQRVEESNNTIKNSLASMVQMIDNYKLSQKQKGKQMNRQQQEDFIEQTVSEILNDQNMVEEVKNRMRPKIEAKVKAALEKQLQDGVQIAKKEFVQKLKQEREQWTQERIAFWKQESNRELEQLAQQHNEINNKKLAIEASYANKKAEKTQLQLKLNMIMEKNAMVSNLRRQLKQLKQKMRA